jgi:hypothetical protein
MYCLMFKRPWLVPVIFKETLKASAENWRLR